MVDWKPFEKKLGMTNCLNLMTHLNLNKLGFYLFIYFFKESFNLWSMLLMMTLYHKTKTLIGFWYRWGLNSRSFIQPSAILPVELTGTYLYKLG